LKNRPTHTEKDDRKHTHTHTHWHTPHAQDHKVTTLDARRSSSSTEATTKLTVEST